MNKSYNYCQTKKNNYHFARSTLSSFLLLVSESERIHVPRYDTTQHNATLPSTGQSLTVKVFEAVADVEPIANPTEAPVPAEPIVNPTDAPVPAEPIVNPTNAPVPKPATNVYGQPAADTSGGNNANAIASMVGLVGAILALALV
jgi:hypothetical protein